MLAVLTCLCSFGVRSCLPHRAKADLAGTGLLLEVQPWSAHLEIAHVSQRGAAPVADTFLDVAWIMKKCCPSGNVMFGTMYNIYNTDCYAEALHGTF